MALRGVLAPLQDHQIPGPANFSHQRCEFFVLGVSFAELLDSPQVRSREAADARELGPEVFGHLLNYRTPLSLALLPLIDESSDVPIER